MGNITFGFWVGCQFWPTESARQIEFHCILDNIVEVDFIDYISISSLHYKKASLQKVRCQKIHWQKWSKGCMLSCLTNARLWSQIESVRQTFSILPLHFGIIDKTAYDTLLRRLKNHEKSILLCSSSIVQLSSLIHPHDNAIEKQPNVSNKMWLLMLA